MFVCSFVIILNNLKMFLFLFIGAKRVSGEI